MRMASRVFVSLFMISQIQYTFGQIECDDNCREFISDGSILVQNHGQFDARFYIKGKRNGTRYCCSSTKFGRGAQDGLPVPTSNSSVDLTVEYEQELFEWVDIFKQSFKYSNITKCYQTMGDKQNATYIEIICPSTS